MATRLQVYFDFPIIGAYYVDLPLAGTNYYDVCWGRTISGWLYVNSSQLSYEQMDKVYSGFRVLSRGV